MTRTEIIDFLEHEETYNSVLKIIQDKGGDDLSHFPLDGFMAGGSIANTIHHILNQTSAPVINDIDIFCLDNSDELFFVRSENDFFDEFTDMGVNQSYGTTYLGPQGERISMYNSERFDIINKVSIRVSNYNSNNNTDFNPISYYYPILKQFDINCCSAGLDRVNNKIIYTEDFVDFLLTNKLEVVTLHTPIKTFIRLHNKIKDLNCYCDLENEISLLKHSFLCSDMFDRRFGDEWYTKVNNNIEIVNQHFEFRKSDNALHSLFINGGTNKNIYRYEPKKFKLKDFAYVFSHNRYSKRGLLVLWDIMVRNKNPEKKQIIDKFLGDFLEKNLIFISNNLNRHYVEELYFYRESILSGDNDVINQCNIYLKKLNFFEAISLVPGYLDKDFSLDDLEKIETFRITSRSTIQINCFFVDNVKDHLETLVEITKMFHDKSKKELDIDTMTKCIRKFNKVQRKNFGTFSKDLKLEALKKSLNNIWIKDLNFFPKFKMKKEY